MAKSGSALTEGEKNYLAYGCKPLQQFVEKGEGAWDNVAGIGGGEYRGARAFGDCGAG